MTLNRLVAIFAALLLALSISAFARELSPGDVASGQDAVVDALIEAFIFSSSALWVIATYSGKRKNIALDLHAIPSLLT